MNQRDKTGAFQLMRYATVHRTSTHAAGEIVPGFIGSKRILPADVHTLLHLLGQILSPIEVGLYLMSHFNGVGLGSVV